MYSICSKDGSKEEIRQIISTETLIATEKRIKVNINSSINIKINEFWREDTDFECIN